MIKKKQIRGPVQTTYCLGIIAIALFFLGMSETLTLTYYSNGIYPILSKFLRFIFGNIPFAVGDLFYFLLILIGLWQFFLFLKKGIQHFRKKKPIQRNELFRVCLTFLNIILVSYISFKLLWGLNYSRPLIAKQLNISDEKYDVKSLVLLGNYFVDKVNDLRSKAKPEHKYNLTVLRQKAVTSYQNLALKHSFFYYQHTSVKPVSANWVISKIGIEGYYNPLSGEANVNMQLVPWVLPFVTCHEISHQLGVAREDEANLVAYLVGINSDDLNFQYSVNYNMLRYIIFELRFKSPTDYLALRNRLSPAVLANFKAENEFWSRYNGNMSKYMGAAFDKFLKMNNQKRGIKSYQNIVIWLWNYHKSEITIKSRGVQKTNSPI
ncbi:MAG: DUF3810 domain-containing protein [Pedobacter sp.]|nr:DUF3810 domain-containing protein [Pedobacter sp.]MDQ8053390.1 DUF3810 domain-containing protein [Pedobacter sp.]